MPGVTPASTVARRIAPRCGVARAPRDVAAHHAIRLQIFVVEQAMFALDDSDEHDLAPSTIKVLAWYGAVPGGCVRLYPLDAPGRWQGDRLAVLRPFRCHGLGAPLVRYAVSTAARLGGDEMVAHIQLANVAFFERLGWRCVGPVETYLGRPHRTMAIELAPFATPVGPAETWLV
jgi:putative N-acetyltransferase (TIGR04045 family)